VISEILLLFLHSMLNNPEKSVHAPPEKPAGAIFALIIGVNDVGPFFLEVHKPYTV
jgi:hypothetical protein